MELNHKIYELTTPVNLSGEQDIRVIVNEEDRGVKLNDVFKKIRGFKPGVIDGYSILEFYQINKEGMLIDKEGNQIYLSTDKNPQILFKNIDDPTFISTEIEVTRNYVRDAGLFLKLINTEETITGLSKADKQALIDERALAIAEEESKMAADKAAEDARLAEESRRIADEEESNKKKEAEAQAAEEESRKSEEAAKIAQEAEDAARKAEEDSKKAAIKAEEDSKKAAIKAEEDAKKAAKDAIEKKKKDMEENEFFLNVSQYKATQKKYARLGYIETSKDGYHFFYGESDDSNDDDNLNHSPFILAEREYGFYEQLSGAIVHENEKAAEYEFTEGDKDKTLILNIAKETFIITDAGE